MKRTLFYLAVFVLAFTGCTEFEEPESVATMAQTRVGAANVFVY